MALVSVEASPPPENATTSLALALAVVASQNSLGQTRDPSHGNRICMSVSLAVMVL